MDAHLQVAGIALISVPILRVAVSAYAAVLLHLTALPKIARTIAALIVYVAFAVIMMVPLFAMLFVARGDSSGPLSNWTTAYVLGLFGLAVLWPLLALKRWLPELRAEGYFG